MMDMSLFDENGKYVETIRLTEEESKLFYSDVIIYKDQTMKPTVGQHLWFFKIKHETGEHEGPFAATVCFVQSRSGYVNLQVLDAKGVSRSETGVNFLSEEPTESDIPLTDYCTWPKLKVGTIKERCRAVHEAAKRGFEGK